MDGVPDEKGWEIATSRYYADVYDNTYEPFTYDHDVVVTITDVIKSDVVPGTTNGGRGLLLRSSSTGGEDVVVVDGGRAMQSTTNDDDASVVVTYTQDLWYRSDDPNIDPTMAFNPLLPLSTNTLRDEYVGMLKDELDGYEYLTGVSEIFASSDGGGGGDDDGGEGGSTGELSIGAIIGIAVGATAALILLALGLLHMSKRRGNKDEDDDRTNHEIPTHVLTCDPELTSASGTAMGSSIPPRSYDQPTIGSMDYDYAAAYGGGMGAGGEASEAGGTMGSRTRQTAADADDMAIGKKTRWFAPPFE
jgi:hypothetical protein